MRTYSGKNFDGSAVRGYKAVSEKEFTADDEMIKSMLGEEDDVEEELGDMETAIGFDEAEESEGPSWIPSPTFAQKMLKADGDIQRRYDELKNYALRFKKLKTRISKKFDSINLGRFQFVKLSVAGKTLKLYLSLDVKETEPKFHCEDVSALKSYAEVPTLLRVKSDRAVKYAKTLIDQCAEKHGLKENPKFTEIDAIATVENFLYNQGEDEE